MTFYRDTVTVTLGDRDTFILSSYSVTLSVFRQPCTFSATLGDAVLFKHLAAAYPPLSKYQIKINDTLIQTGFIDKISRSGGLGTPTQVQLTGRDPVAKLIGSVVDSERSFKESTYADITRAAMDEVGLNEVELVASNDANRKAITGSRKVSQDVEPSNLEEQTPAPSSAQTPRESKMVAKTLRTQVGNTWWQFLTEHYRRAGLFLWSTHDGELVLSRPTPDQNHIASLIRGQGFNNILSDEFSIDTANRHSEFIVYGLGGGGKQGPSRVTAKFIDDEMVEYLNPDPADRADGGKVKRRQSFRDRKIRSVTEAHSLAVRHICDERREGWHLAYSYMGHSIVGVDGKQRVLPAPDTVLMVDDQELGINGPMWVHEVAFDGTSSSTTTKVQLMRTEDVMFDTEAIVASTKGARPKKTEWPGNNYRVARGVGSSEALMSDSDDPYANYIGPTGSPTTYESYLDELDAHQEYLDSISGDI